MFFFINQPITSLYANPQRTEKSAVAVTPIDELIDEAQKQLNMVSIALTTVSGIINDKVTSTVSNKEEALTHIRSLNSLINTLRKELFASVDLHTAYSLLQFTKAISEHALFVLDNNFKKVAEFNMDALINRAVVDQEIEDIQIAISLLLENETRLKKLTKKADSFGLRWYNYAYRKFDDLLITPAQKKSIPKRLLTASAVGFLGCYGWWRFGLESFKRKAPRPIVALFGTEVPDHNMGLRDIDGQPTRHFDRLGPIGKLDYTIGEMLNNWSPLGRYTAVFVAGAFALEWKNNKEGMTKKVSEWVNWLRGGSYLQEAQRAAEKVEKVYFKDIFGQEDIIRYFQLLVDYLANPEPFDRLGLTPPKGILCVGDTRTGKTYAVTALFNEIMDMLKKQGKSGKFKFFNLSAARINYYGIKSLLDDIKHSAPCIVFIDEIDLLDLQRTGKNETLSEFLTCMSGTLNSKDSKNQVIIIAATNRPENLDVALRQPGRFGKELRFEYPNTTDRANYIKHKIDKLSLDAKDFDIQKLAQATHKRSYEALKMLIDNALLHARINDDLLTQEYIEQSLSEDVYHIIPNNNKQIPTHEKEILSAHFAGQALALILLNPHSQLSSVTIKQVMTDIKEEMMGMHLWKENQKDQQRFEYGKIFVHHDQDSINLNTRDEQIKLCKFYLAGFAAEEILLGSCGYSCHAEFDKSNALRHAQYIVLEGLEMDKMPNMVKEKKYTDIIMLLEQYKNEIKDLLANNIESLKKISIALQEHGTLDAAQIKKLI